MNNTAGEYYSRLMAEQSAHYREEINELRHLLWAAAQSYGGVLRIDDRCLHASRPGCTPLTFREDAENRAMFIEATNEPT